MEESKVQSYLPPLDQVKFHALLRIGVNICVRKPRKNQGYKTFGSAWSLFLANNKHQEQMVHAGTSSAESSRNFFLLVIMR